MDTLAHQYLLLELHDASGVAKGIPVATRWFAFAGALFAELQLQNRVVAVESDVFAVASGDPLPGVLGAAEAHLGRKKRSASMCLYRLYNRAYYWRKEAAQDLVQAGALEKVQDRFLGLPWRTRWPTADATIEVDLIAHLRTWLDTVPPDAPPGREDLLLSLLRGTDQLVRVWTPDEVARLKPRIDERTRMAPIGGLVHDMVLHGADLSRYRR